MATRQPQPRASFTVRFVRRWRLDRNPLRRPADRAETSVLILLVVTFLVTAPLAALVSGAWVHSMAQRAELAQAASRSQVTAVVLTPPVSASVGYWDTDAVTQARWTAPDGAVITGALPVTPSAPDGRLGNQLAGHRPPLDHPHRVTRAEEYDDDIHRL